MLWRGDKIKPTQPYFVLDTADFRQEVYLKQGISHFYNFSFNIGGILRVVPDGCVDFFFEYKDGKMKGYACGTRSEYVEEDWHQCGDVFGVRFMPGKHPSMLKATMSQLIGKGIPIENVIEGNPDWLSRLEKETDFYQRIRVFLEYFTKAEKNASVLYGKKALIQSIKNEIYDSNGLVHIQKIADESGYTERYINKVFHEEMGFSPKTFCKIIQFQRVLEYLNYGTPNSMTDLATNLGYYDQPQFIRDFKKYAGITPKKYLKMVQSKKYIELINTNKDKGVWQ